MTGGVSGPFLSDVSVQGVIRYSNTIYSELSSMWRHML